MDTDKNRTMVSSKANISLPSKGQGKMTILLAEDECAIRELLRMTLHEAGYDILSTTNGVQALGLATKEIPELIILDWMLPEMNGLEVLSALRSNAAIRHIPVIMLTARGAENDRITGLDFGADDYITKPFSPKELLARMRALLRRSQPETTAILLHCSDITLSVTERRVWRGDNDIHLGPTEFRLLEYFMRHPRRVFSRQQLLDHAWEYDTHIDERTVDVHIRRLRKALNLYGKDVIRTVRSMGYALEHHAD